MFTKARQKAWTRTRKPDSQLRHAPVSLPMYSQSHACYLELNTCFHFTCPFTFYPKAHQPTSLQTPNLNSQINPSLPSPIPLENLLNHYKPSQSQLSSPPFSASNFELYESLVTRYRDSRSLTDAEEFHCQVLKHGFDGDLFLSNSLINVYVRAGELMSARKLLDEMPGRNPVTWACLISGYNQNGMPKEACRIFKEMVYTGFWPTHYAFGSGLRACQELGSCGLQFGLQIQCWFWNLDFHL